VSEDQSADSAATAVTPSAEPLTLDVARPAAPPRSATDDSTDTAVTVREGVDTPLPRRPTSSATVPPPVADPAIASATAEPAVPRAPVTAPEPAAPRAPVAAPEPAVPRAPVAAPEPAAPRAPEAAPEPAVPRASEAAPEPAEPLAVVVTLPPEKRGRGPIITLLIAIVVLAVLAAVGYFVVRRVYADPTRDATAGDCLRSLPVVEPGQDKEASDAEVVDCGDATASHRVEGRLDNQTADQVRSADVCKAFPEATFIYRAVPDSGNGYVLCLKKLTP
jgi:hypothetical protein